jgi:hypothetical protein
VATVAPASARARLAGHAGFDVGHPSNHVAWFAHALTGAGFSAAYARVCRVGSVAAGGISTGELVAWRTEQFDAIAAAPLCLGDAVLDLVRASGDPGVQAARSWLSAFPQVAMAVVLRHRGSGASVVVCSARLAAAGRAPHVSVLQAAALVRALEALAKRHSAALVLLAGTLGCLPSEPAYRLLVDGALDARSVGAAAVIAEATAAGVRATALALAAAPSQLRLRSAYSACLGREPAFTAYTPRFRGCEDYLFVGAVGSDGTGSGGVSRVLGEASEEALAAHAGLPSPTCPSDHLPLAAGVYM